MKFRTTFAALTMSAAVLAAADPVPRFFDPEQEAAIRRIVRDELKSAALEAQPARPQAAPAAALPPAPAVTSAAFECVSYDGGRSWVTRQVPGTCAATRSTPAFATPVRDALSNFATPSACAGGQCPTPRRR